MCAVPMRSSPARSAIVRASLSILWYARALSCICRMAVPKSCRAVSSTGQKSLICVGPTPALHLRFVQVHVCRRCSSACCPQYACPPARWRKPGRAGGRGRPRRATEWPPRIRRGGRRTASGTARAALPRGCRHLHLRAVQVCGRAVGRRGAFGSARSSCRSTNLPQIPKYACRTSGILRTSAAGPVMPMRPWLTTYATSATASAM